MGYLIGEILDEKLMTTHLFTNLERISEGKIRQRCQRVGCWDKLKDYII